MINFQYISLASHILFWIINSIAFDMDKGVIIVIIKVGLIKTNPKMYLQKTLRHEFSIMYLSIFHLYIYSNITQKKMTTKDKTIKVE